MSRSALRRPRESALQPGQPVVEVLVAAFDEAVGVKQDHRAPLHGDHRLPSGRGRVHAEKQIGAFGHEELHLSVEGQDHRRGRAGV